MKNLQYKKMFYQTLGSSRSYGIVYNLGYKMK